jgi:hypothetical protein
VRTQVPVVTVHPGTKGKNSWPESANDLYPLSDRRLSAKLMPTFVDRDCHVISMTYPYSCIHGFLDGIQGRSGGLRLASKTCNLQVIWLTCESANAASRRIKPITDMRYHKILVELCSDFRNIRLNTVNTVDHQLRFSPSRFRINFAFPPHPILRSS